jgi:hypothetical protein
MNKQVAFAVLIFFMAGFLIFYPILSVGFVSDDFVWLKESQNPQQFNLFNSQSFASTKGRPGTMALFQILSELFSSNGGRFHLVILVFHILNASLLFANLRRFRLSFGFSFLTALVFLIHFSNEEPLFWISCLSSIFCLFFYLCGVFLYLKYLKSGSLVLKLAIVGCSLVALSIREDALSIPITLVLLNYINKRERGLTLSNLLSSNVIFFLPSFIHLGWRITAAVHESMGYEFTLNPTLWVQNGLYFIFNLLVPIRFIFDQVGYNAHETLRLKIIAIKNIRFLIPVGLFLLMAFSFLAIRLRNKVSQLVRVGCILGMIGFLPYFALVGNAPRFLYFTLIGGAIVIVSGIFWLSKRISNTAHRLVFVSLGVILVVINFIIIQERSRWWIKSTQVAVNILQQTKTLADGLVPGDTLYVVNLPRRLNGAYIFHNGYKEAVSFITPEIAARVRYLEDKNLDKLKEFRGRRIITFENGKAKEMTDR